MTHLVEDSRNYYTQRSFGPDDRRAGAFWVDMDDLQHGQVRMHRLLSNTHKQAARVALSFPFPFYGHYLKQITIATGGFIFMGDVTHRMLTATQYVAPLMANFDPSSAKESTVQYLDNGEVFVVQWERVRLHGRESEGEFTFQAALYRSGTITFSYRDIPLSVEQIISGQHPVKAGLSDAFMVVKPSSKTADARQRTIYEYHRVQIDTAKITNNCAFEFTALPSCLQHNSCELCFSANQTLGCKWCHVLQSLSEMREHRSEFSSADLSSVQLVCSLSQQIPQGGAGLPSAALDQSQRGVEVLPSTQQQSSACSCCSARFRLAEDGRNDISRNTVLSCSSEFGERALKAHSHYGMSLSEINTRQDPFKAR
ncbi:unnamed protein product [Boreogadus saida]